MTETTRRITDYNGHHHTLCAPLVNAIHRPVTVIVGDARSHERVAFDEWQRRALAGEHPQPVMKVVIETDDRHYTAPASAQTVWDIRTGRLYPVSLRTVGDDGGIGLWGRYIRHR